MLYALLMQSISKLKHDIPTGCHLSVFQRGALTGFLKSATHILCGDLIRCSAFSVFNISLIRRSMLNVERSMFNSSSTLHSPLSTLHSTLLSTLSTKTVIIPTIPPNPQVDNTLQIDENLS